MGADHPWGAVERAEAKAKAVHARALGIPFTDHEGYEALAAEAVRLLREEYRDHVRRTCGLSKTECPIAVFLARYALPGER